MNLHVQMGDGTLLATQYLTEYTEFIQIFLNEFRVLAGMADDTISIARAAYPDDDPYEALFHGGVILCS